MAWGWVSISKAKRKAKGVTDPPDATGYLASAFSQSITIAIARFDDMMELRRLNAELQTRNEDLQAALAKLKTLSGLLPICANCKKIRDDEGYWHQLEQYIETHSEADFSHGLCPKCLEKLYGEEEWYQKSKQKKNT